VSRRAACVRCLVRFFRPFGAVPLWLLLPTARAVGYILFRRFAALTRAERMGGRPAVCRSFGTEIPKDNAGVEIQVEIRRQES
jgi:hypothetical protein